MLFRKNIEPRCAYCARAFATDDDSCFCRKHGVVSAGYHCRSFKYDPLKRVPPRPAKLNTDFSDEDFSLD